MICATMKSMYRFIVYLSIISSLFYILPNKTSAITPTTPPIPTIGLPIPGFNCGDASNTKIQGCCKITTITPASRPYTGVLSVVANFISDKLKTNPILKMQREIGVVPCSNGSPSTPGDQNSPACICIIAPTPVPLSVLVPLCNKIANSSERTSCENCASNKGGVWTSVGCYNGNVSSFISHFLEMGISLAGGISLLCIMFAAFQMQTSSGNAEKVKKAQELLTNCITGLMIIIFSVLILKIIGVDILRIPGFK